MNLSLGCSVVCLLTASFMAQGQTAKAAIETVDNRPCRSVKSQMSYASQEDPSLNAHLAGEDFATLVTAQKRLQSAYEKRGLDSCDSTEATVLAWRYIRARQPNGHLDEDALVKFAGEGFGGLKIVSTPPGAAIRVDSKPWDRPTNTMSWTRVGTRTITLSRDGYEDSQGEQVVVAGTVVEYQRKLLKKK
jgi:hypothetical protein